MAIVIADSDVLIDFLRGNAGALRVRTALEGGFLCSTAISVFELLFGAKSKKQLHAIQTVLDSLQIFECTEESAMIAAEIAQDLEKQGQRIGMADYLIAGICIERSGILLTNNRRHFERIPKLRIAA